MKAKTKILIGFFLLSLPGIVFADQIMAIPERSNIKTGEQFIVNVALTTEGALNAVEGQLQYPDNLLKVVDIRDGNSPINFWLENPHVAALGSISFSGLTPGGFMGTDKRIFSVLFEAKSASQPELIFKNVAAYLNDGNGTKAKLDAKSSKLTVTASNGEVRTDKTVDTETPEDFTPIISSDNEVFGGKYFLAFATQDKGKGIDHYEIREGLLARYRTAVSPYLLARQGLDRTIYLKAVDKSGNERLVIIPARNEVPLWKQPEWLAVFVVAIAIYEILKFLLKRKSQSESRVKPIVVDID